MKICAFHETHGALTNITVLDERQVVTRVGVVYYLVQVCVCVCDTKCIAWTSTRSRRLLEKDEYFITMLITR